MRFIENIAAHAESPSPKDNLMPKPSGFRYAIPNARYDRPDSVYIIARACACERRMRQVACGKCDFIQTEEER
jgi:hypothetical protein